MPLEAPISGLAAASPEIGINIASAATDVADIILGTMLGSNAIAIPRMVITAYLATRHLKKEKENKKHEQHLEKHLLKVNSSAVTVQAVLYLIITGFITILTVPKQWRGLQPMDSWIMPGAYLVYLAQALIRGKEKAKR